MGTLSLVQWIGGKGIKWKWISDHFPEHRVYVEPFGGGAHVLLNKLPSEVEVYNDINGNLVNLFRNIQDIEKFKKLLHRLKWTLYSREEFETALNILKDPLSKSEDRAWAFFVAQNQGFGGHATTVGNWGRGVIKKYPHVFSKKVDKLKLIRDRIKNVLIENQDGVEVIKYWDKFDNVLFYVDPPYPLNTRSSKILYKHEMTDEQHERLIETILSCKNKFVVSSFRNETYDKLLNYGFRLVEKEYPINSTNRRYSAPKCVEVLYVNYPPPIEAGACVKQAIVD